MVYETWSSARSANKVPEFCRCWSAPQEMAEVAAFLCPRTFLQPVNHHSLDCTPQNIIDYSTYHVITNIKPALSQSNFRQDYHIRTAWKMSVDTDATHIHCSIFSRSCASCSTYTVVFPTLYVRQELKRNKTQSKQKSTRSEWSSDKPQLKKRSRNCHGWCWGKTSWNIVVHECQQSKHHTNVRPPVNRGL